MNLIVVGCGRVGAELAYRLSQNGHWVTVIDRNSNSFHGLPEDFSGRTVEGEAMNQDILRRAGFDTAEGVAIVTNSDAVNAIVGHVSRSIYNIPIVVVRNYDSHWRSLHEIFGYQVISSSSWGAQRIEELLYHEEGHTVFSAGNGEIELYEFTIPSEWHAKRVDDLVVTGECIVAALTRAGRAFIPNPGTALETGDLLLISATLTGSLAVRARIQSSPA